jgi:hypothetical protein
MGSCVIPDHPLLEREWPVQKTVQRTYPQNWTAYNAVQTHEKERFLDLLRDLCSGVEEPPNGPSSPPDEVVSPAAELRDRHGADRRRHSDNWARGWRWLLPCISALRHWLL